MAKNLRCSLGKHERRLRKGQPQTGDKPCVAVRNRLAVAFAALTLGASLASARPLFAASASLEAPQPARESASLVVKLAGANGAGKVEGRAELDPDPDKKGFTLIGVTAPSAGSSGYEVTLREGTCRRRLAGKPVKHLGYADTSDNETVAGVFSVAIPFAAFRRKHFAIELHQGGFVDKCGST